MALFCRSFPRAILLRNVTKTSPLRIAAISTTKKDKDSTTAVTPQLFDETAAEKFDARVTQKTWVSWGYSTHNREEDATMVHAIFFMSVTLCLVAGGFWIAYAPRGIKDWAQREAYLEIRRREKAGLPHVDPFIVPPEQVVLPTDEELGDQEIII